MMNARGITWRGVKGRRTSPRFYFNTPTAQVASILHSRFQGGPMMLVFRWMTAIVVVGLSTVAVACGGGATPAPPAAAEAPAPAPSSQVLRDLRTDWQAQKDTMTKIADAMPEGKFGYKSTPPQRNYGEQIMHVALTNVELLKILGGKTTPPALTVESAKTKAD